MNLKIFEMINNTNDETKVINAEQMLRYIHRILEPEAGRIPFGERNRISWEIFAQEGRIRFYVVVPERLSQFIKQKICLCYSHTFPLVVFLTIVKNDSSKLNRYSESIDSPIRFIFLTYDQLIDFQYKIYESSFGKKRSVLQSIESKILDLIG